MKTRVLLTGATGMVGEGVLHECLLHDTIDEIVLVSRKSCGITHPKLKEIIHADFFDLTPIENQLQDFAACFFCLGVSSIGMKEPEYSRLTYDLTLNFARTLSRLNPEMIFCYISGAGTDSTQNSRSMWARVKGKTENHIMSLRFKRSYMFRPAFIYPTKGLKNTLKMYRYISWLYPVMLLIMPRYVCTLREIGIAMINCIHKGPSRSVLEVKQIVVLAHK